MTFEAEADLWLAYWRLAAELTRFGATWSAQGRRAIEELNNAQRELDEVRRREARS